jgi:hypothetical protein
MQRSQILTNEQLEQKLKNNCCGKEMILVESHSENSRICYKYVCSQCNGSLFDYGEKPKKTITLTAAEYEDLLSDIRSIHQRLYEAKPDSQK